MISADIETIAARIAPVEPAPGETDLLRFTTAGSVDDGKSTLIGRLLYDSKSVYEDQIASIKKSGINRSGGLMDLSLLTDGLKAEREQGITIDVAYRYFATPRRRFIIADTPGHEQYTRNMATGASTADAAVVLIDASKGLLPQSRRHTYIASLLGIREVIAAINKMDLVDYREDVFDSISRDFRALASQLGIPSVHIIPVSALKGDNIVHAGAHTPWYGGDTLLECLENLPVQQTETSTPLRLPIQYVIRPDARFRGFAGQVASGVLHRGATVTALPSGIKTRIKEISTFDGGLNHAGAGSSITVTLDDEIDLSRGDLLVGENDVPQSASSLRAKLVWLQTEPSQSDKFYLLKQSTRLVRAKLARILHRVDVNTLAHLAAPALQTNDIAVAEIETTLPLFFDPYRQNRTMGSFILIDPITNATVAAGMIEGKAEPSASASIAPQSGTLTEQRTLRNGHPPAALWITGESEVAEKLEQAIFEKGWQVHLVTGGEFQGVDATPLVSMLKRMGIVAVFSVDADQPSLRQAVTAIYGEKSVLEINAAALSEQDARETAMNWLRELQSKERQSDELQSKFSQGRRQ
ncbi:MAG TPA: sulfate adenylyltransferase subunit CysN [Candidatus Angelobacter sp.]|nr:sulfate adenylyltransferase subunit CysN [Candidatus Angelobacter sp.]